MAGKGKEFLTKIVIGGRISDSLQKSLVVTEKKLKESKESLAKMGSAIAKGIAGGTVAAATAFIGLAEGTREYRQQQAELTSAFESVNGTTAAATQTYKALQRVLGDSGQATEAAVHLAELTTNQEHLAEWTNACQGIYAKFNKALPLEGLTEAANETAKVGKVTGPLADALNWTTLNTDKWNSVLGENNRALKAYNNALKSGENQEDAFNAALATLNTQSEREALIRVTLNSSYAKSAASYEKNAAGVLKANEAQEKLNNVMAKLGKVAEPIVAIFKDKLATVMDSLAPVVEKVGQGLEKLASVPLDKLQTPLILIGGAIAAITAGITAYNIAIVAKSVADKIHEKGLWGTVKAQLAANAAFLACPIFWIVASVVALIAVFVLLWNKFEGFRNFWKTTWEVIKVVALTVWELIKSAFFAAVEYIKAVFTPIIAYFQMIFNNIKLIFGVIGDVLSGDFQGAKDKIMQIFGNIGNFFKTVFDSIKTAASVPLKWLTDKFDVIKNGIEKVKEVFGWGGKKTKVKAYANGGTVTRPHMAIVGDAPETIVPHGNTARNRALLAEAAANVTGGATYGGVTNITFAPVIQDGSGADVKRAITESEIEFEQKMDRYFKKKGRVSFA